MSDLYTRTTGQGCKVRAERVGESVGITITQADGKSALYTCNRNEMVAIANLLLEVSVLGTPSENG